MTRVCLKSNSYGLAFDRLQFYSGLDWTKELLSVFRKYYRFTYISMYQKFVQKLNIFAWPMKQKRST